MLDSGWTDGRLHSLLTLASFIPVAAWIIGSAVGGAVTLLVFGTDGKHEGWGPNWSAGGPDVRHRENWRKWSASLMHWAAH